MDFQMGAVSRRVFPELESLEDRSKIIVINTINQAKERVGIRQDLHELADTAGYATRGNRLTLKTVETPIPITAEKFIWQTIENEWHLANVFKYCVNYKGESTDEASHYYYFEAIFSQPTPEYPIPPATASIFFRIEDRKTEVSKAPQMWFRIEGEYTDHDVRYVAPTANWLLAVLMKKTKIFKRVESFRLF